MLRLADLDTRHDAGRKLEEATRHILEQQNAERSDEISLEQVRAFRKTYALTSPNGDGVLSPGQISDPAAARLANDVLEHVGGIEDISGAEGVAGPHGASHAYHLAAGQGGLRALHRLAGGEAAGRRGRGEAEGILERSGSANAKTRGNYVTEYVGGESPLDKVC
jgi:hypothetical protein